MGRPSFHISNRPFQTLDIPSDNGRVLLELGIGWVNSPVCTVSWFTSMRREDRPTPTPAPLETTESEHAQIPQAAIWLNASYSKPGTWRFGGFQKLLDWVSNPRPKSPHADNPLLVFFYYLFVLFILNSLLFPRLEAKHVTFECFASLSAPIWLTTDAADPGKWIFAHASANWMEWRTRLIPI